jgi:hypothetical protein
MPGDGAVAGKQVTIRPTPDIDDVDDVGNGAIRRGAL